MRPDPGSSGAEWPRAIPPRSGLWPVLVAVTGAVVIAVSLLAAFAQRDDAMRPRPPEERTMAPWPIYLAGVPLPPRPYGVTRTSAHCLPIIRATQPLQGKFDSIVDTCLALETRRGAEHPLSDLRALYVERMRDAGWSWKTCGSLLRPMRGWGCVWTRTAGMSVYDAVVAAGAGRSGHLRLRVWATRYGGNLL